MITLQQIANQAGVSRMTVSNVINGKTEKVSAQKRELIEKIIKENNYVPNLSARALAQNHSKMIAILLTTASLEYNIFNDPYYGRLFGEVETAIRCAGYYTIVQTIDNISDASTLLRNWNVDGAVFLNSLPQSDISLLHNQISCPTVFLDKYSDESDNELSVNIDDVKGGYIATKYLLTNGHRKIGFVGSYELKNEVIIKRYKGYLKALEEFGLTENDAYIINTYTTYDAGLKIGKDIANHKYDLSAVFATSDHLALGIVKGCLRNGYLVPNDLSVIGFDDLDICTFSTPEISTVSQNIHEKATKAVQLLLSAIKKEDIQSSSIVCDVELKIRQTVQAFRS